MLNVILFLILIVLLALYSELKSLRLSILREEDSSAIIISATLAERIRAENEELSEEEEREVKKAIRKLSITDIN